MTDDWSWDQKASKSASFDGKPPIKWGGEITEILDARQATKLDPERTPKTWRDGRPIRTRPVHIATDARDPHDPEDDGTRSLFFEEGTIRFRKLGEALRRAGVKSPEVGGYIEVAYTADLPKQPGQQFPLKDYEVNYRPPAETGDPWNVGTAAPAAAPVAAAAPTSAPTPPAPDPNVAKLINHGLDAARVAQMDNATRAMLVAQFNL